MFDLPTISLTVAGVFVIALMKGGFGGGFAIVGIPLLALVMDPITAGALLAPLFVAMDLVALRYWKPSTWSKPDLKVLLPSLVIGVALGTLLVNELADASLKRRGRDCACRPKAPSRRFCSVRHSGKGIFRRS